MRALARAGALRKLPRLRGQGARLRTFHVHLMDAGAPDAGEREVWIFSDRAVKSLGRTVPGRKQAVDAITIMRGGAVGGGRQRQIVAVMIHLAPRTRLIQVNAVTP